MVDSLNEQYENEARKQLGVGEDYRLCKIASAIAVDLEERIDQLGRDSDLEDDQKWAEIAEAADNPRLAWLPQGWLLVAMRHCDSPFGQVDASCFIQVSCE